MSLSRRSFFRNIKDDVLENLTDSLEKKGLSKLLERDVKNKNNPVEWLEVGHISDFPPNTEKVIAESYVLISKPEGFFSITLEDHINKVSEPRINIKIDNTGNIFIKTDEFSNEKSIFSIIINDFIIEEEVL